MAERSRLEIYLDVLIAIWRGHHGTDGIMLDADVAPSSLEEMLESLTSLGFVESVKVLDWRDGEIRAHIRFTVRGENLMRWLTDHDEVLDGRGLRKSHLYAQITEFLNEVPEGPSDRIFLRYLKNRGRMGHQGLG